MTRWRDIKSGAVSLDRLAEQHDGWLGTESHPIGEDPPELAGCRLPVLTRPDEPRRER